MIINFTCLRCGACSRAALIRGRRLFKRLMPQTRPDAENTLAGHLPIELSRLLTFFLQANADNLLTAKVTGKRKREVSLVAPAKFTAFTQELVNTKILKRELNERALKLYSVWTEKTSLLMKINSHCLLRGALQRLQRIFIILWKYLNERHTAAAALIRGQHLLTVYNFWIDMLEN